MFTALACVIGAIVFGIAAQAWLRLADQDLRISPTRRVVQPEGQVVTFPLRVHNLRDEDLSDRAFVITFKPALPRLMDAVVIPPLQGPAITGAAGTILERSIHSRWTQGDSTVLLFFIDVIYANETIDYQATITTGGLSHPVRMTATQVAAQEYAHRRARVALADSPNEALARTLPQKLVMLANSPTGSVCLVVGDGEWRTATRTYQELLPVVHRDLFRVRLFRDADDYLKIEVRTRWFAGGVASMPLSEIPASSTHVICFGWTEKGIMMKVDLRPSVYAGTWEEPVQTR